MKGRGSFIRSSNSINADCALQTDSALGNNPGHVQSVGAEAVRVPVFGTVAISLGNSLFNPEVIDKRGGWQAVKIS